jgi:hypothetical protein
MLGGSPLGSDVERRNKGAFEKTEATSKATP